MWAGLVWWLVAFGFKSAALDDYGNRNLFADPPDDADFNLLVALTLTLRHLMKTPEKQLDRLFSDPDDLPTWAVSVARIGTLALHARSADPAFGRSRSSW
jgi:hypothetical protein